MPILNYTTKVNPWTTVNEIQKILAKNKATHCSIKNEGSWPVAISFTMTVNNTPLNFLLPCNHEGVFNALKRNKDVPAKSKNLEHALAVSWRILKTWIDVQMAVVESGLISAPEVFLSHLIVNNAGDTLSKKILQDGGMKLLN
jgi:hypothetical protein